MLYRKRFIILAAMLLLSLQASGVQADGFECDASVIDVVAPGTETDEAAPAADVYVAPRKKMEVTTESVFRVFRRGEVSEDSVRQYPLRHYIGRLEIFDVQENILVGRMIEFASRQDYPRVRYETVMIGDCLELEPAPRLMEIPPEALPAETLDVSALEFPGAAGMFAQRRVIPSRILFKFDSSVVERKWDADLEHLARYIKRSGPARVIVEGHADWIGTDEYNIKLSRRRAQAMVDKLVTRYGLERGLFEIEAYGESRPVATNKTAEGRQKNRRAAASVLFTVIPTTEPSAEAPPDWPPAVEPGELVPEDAEIPVIPD